MTDSGKPDVDAGAFITQIVETIREPVLVLTEQGQIVTANDPLCAHAGMAREALAGRSLFEVNDGLWDSPVLRQLVAHAAASDHPIRDVEFTQHSPDGARTLVMNARALRGSAGDQPIVLLVAEDVTERRRLDQALRQTVAELERSNHDLEAFASIASHDLQEPLRKIRAFGERLETSSRATLSEESRSYLARMLGAAERMQRLIGSLLALARIGERTSTWRPVDLNLLVREVLRDLEEAIARCGARIEVGPLPVIDGDPTNFAQLFQNLIGNALKFHSDDPPVIRISAARLGAERPIAEPERLTWRITVEDNGIGFDPEHAERIFRPLERLHPRGEYDGAGLGLALCQRIVQRHGGVIRAEGQRGVGSRFIVLLAAERQEA